MENKMGEFKNFCKLYYINAVLSSRLQQLLQQRVELNQSMMRVDISVSQTPILTLCLQK